MYTKRFDSPPQVKTLNRLDVSEQEIWKEDFFLAKNVRVTEKADHVHIDTSKITNLLLFLVYFILYKEGIVFFTSEHHCLNCRDYTSES